VEAGRSGRTNENASAKTQKLLPRALFYRILSYCSKNKKPGDGFKTFCHYRNKDDITFGLSSQEEMGIAFLFYYPRKLYLDTLP